jgi:hypothetical protein
MFAALDGKCHVHFTSLLAWAALLSEHSLETLAGDFAWRSRVRDTSCVFHARRPAPIEAIALIFRQKRRCRQMARPT